MSFSKVLPKYVSLQLKLECECDFPWAAAVDAAISRPVTAAIATTSSFLM
jgi:hypothetical protein